jgi:hypothetical protein
MRHEQERADLEYQAECLTGTAEQQQALPGNATHQQGVLNDIEAKNTRRYFEGLVKLTTLKALHYDLVVQTSEGAQPVVSVQKTDHEGAAQTITDEAANQVKSSGEVTLTERGRNRARTEFHVHHAKAEAFAMLGDRYGELGNECLAQSYHERARLESASARGFDTVIKAYDKKLEEMGATRLVRPESPGFLRSFRSLEHAERYLEDYNSGYTRVRSHTRRVLASERTIRRLETACASKPQTAVEHQLLKDAIDRGEKLKRLAEREVFDAVSSYRNFQKEIESVEKAYEAITHALTGNPAELISASPRTETSGFIEHSQPRLEASGNPEGSRCSVGETAISDTPELKLDEPGLQVSQSGVNEARPSGHRQSRAIVAAVITQTLKEMDREL